ncbi:hypothetical protein VTJ04DRAFT_9342 [Mycothermus thermophilus]|uniref:uncharacterized protein n=1 Tax=Humicola insolens TaxID=85995 RepID=UPI0037447115
MTNSTIFASVPQFKYFLALPAEIRLKIYDSALVVWESKEAAETREIKPKTLNHYPETKLCEQNNTPTRCYLALFRVCKQVAAESIARFYAVNTFHFDSVGGGLSASPSDNEIDESSPMLSWLRQIGRNALHVRKIQYCFIPYAVEDIGAATVELRWLITLAPNLRTLSIHHNPDYVIVGEVILVLGFEVSRTFNEGKGDNLIEQILEGLDGALDKAEDLRLVADWRLY